MTIDSDTTEIIGRWISDGNGSLRRDEAAQFIRDVTQNRFRKLAKTGGGWVTLYRDPVSGRLWERTFPQGHLHGGGPPLLRVISEAEAREKYGSPAVEEGRRQSA